jgi:hypothetical protein
MPNPFGECRIESNQTMVSELQKLINRVPFGGLLNKETVKHHAMLQYLSRQYEKLDDWEKVFVDSLFDRQDAFTSKQVACLKKIYKKYLFI